MPFIKLKCALPFLNYLYPGLASILLMSVVAAQAAPAHLINISARAPIQGGAYDIIAGFGISGTGTQRVILRGIKIDAGVDPKLTLRTFGGDFLDENDNWQQGSRANEISQLPSHLQPTTLNDAALLLDLAPGYYTATLSSVGAKGIGLVGIDAIETNGASTEIELINISARALVQGGDGDIIAGFGISGTGEKRVILRGIQIETGVDPNLVLRTISGDLLNENDQWQSAANINEIKQLPTHLQPTSTNDAALLLGLPAGYYTVTLSSVGAKGIELVGVDVVNIETSPPPSDTEEPAEFQGIVATHNKWRQQVGVPDLVWSSQAAKVAQAWADDLKSRGCPLAHNPNRGQYGENAYKSFGLSPTPSNVVDSWAGEIVDYDYATNTCKAGKVCGHYTQVVWRDTQQVGCGKASCNSQQVWICNYSPPGNWRGQKPY